MWSTGVTSQEYLNFSARLLLALISTVGTVGPAGRHQKLQAQLELAKFGWPTTSSLDALRAELGALAEPADVKALVEVTARVRGAGDLEAQRTDAARRLEVIGVNLTNAVGALGLGGTDPRAVDTVAAPAVKTIGELRGEFEKLTGTSLVSRSRLQIWTPSAARRQPSSQSYLASNSPRKRTNWRPLAGRLTPGRLKCEANRPDTESPSCS